MKSKTIHIAMVGDTIYVYPTRCRRKGSVNIHRRFGKFLRITENSKNYTIEIHKGMMGKKKIEGDSLAEKIGNLVLLAAEMCKTEE
jgi:formamidopyrimidine-DNA glycosylase